MARSRYALLTLLAFVSTAVVSLGAPARGAGAAVVVSQLYGGGGNAGATLTRDFIEVFNRGDHPVDLGGWSVQYASAAGTRWQATPLSGTLEPGRRYLVAEGGGGGGTDDLPTPDASGTIAMSATSGRVALVSSTTPLACGTSCAGASGVVDLVGYGSATPDHEGSAAAPTLSNTTAAIRGGGGCVDSDDNGADFEAGTPSPRNTSAPPEPCSGLADLTLTEETTDASPRTGTTTIIRLRVWNAGPARATGVTLTDTLPFGLVLELARPEGACTETDGTVTCRLGTVEAGSSAAVYFIVSPTLAGDATNTAAATADQLDPTPATSAGTLSVTGPDCGIVGTPASDDLTGTDASDVICSLGGNDVVDAGPGDDRVEAGMKNDRVIGGTGDDVLAGWIGGDTLVGGAGADALDGGEQGDILDAVDGVSGNDAIDGGPSEDKCRHDPGDVAVSCG